MASPSHSRAFLNQNQSATGSIASGSHNNNSGISISSGAFKNGTLKSPRSATRLAETKTHQPLSQPSFRLPHYQPPSASRRQSLLDPPRSPLTPADLFDLLLAAKTNLSSIAHAVEANSVATAGASLLEAGVAIYSTSQHMATNIFHQMTIVRAFREHQVKTIGVTDAELAAMVRDVEKAEGDLKMKLAAMGKVVVEKELRPIGEGRKTLLDFIEHSNIQNLEQELETALEELQKYREEYLHEIDTFTTEINQIPELLLTFAPPLSNLSKSSSATPNAAVATLTSLYRQAQVVVENIASALTSLSNHYDHCLLAVRYTPSAFALAATQTPGVFEDEDLEALEAKRPANTDELLLLYKVIMGDKDVAASSVGTINELGRQVASLISEMQGTLRTIDASRQNIYQAVALLSDIGGRMKDMAEMETMFLKMWNGERQKITDGIVQINQLTTTYDGCCHSYTALLVEADRRRQVEDRIFHIYAKAQKEAQKLIAYDRVEVDRFRGQWGEWMPKDLWPLLETDMTDFDVKIHSPLELSPGEQEMLDGRTEEGRMPRLDKMLVENAARGLGKMKEMRQTSERHGHGYRDRDWEREHGHREAREVRDRHPERHR